VAFGAALWWPKAIHEGNGIARYYIDPASTPEQREALDEVFSGRLGGGFFAIVPKTVRKLHPTKVAKIDFHFNGYDSWFKIDGVGEVKSEHIKNPVTGAPFEGTLDLPGGIIFKKGIISSIKSWWMSDGDLLARHENKNGHVAVAKYANDGCVG
jgi:hypothetical protein